MRERNEQGKIKESDIGIFDSIGAKKEIYGGCRQGVKASDCGSDIRGFESHHPPHILKRLSFESLFNIWQLVEERDIISILHSKLFGVGKISKVGGIFAHQC